MRKNWALIAMLWLLQVVNHLDRANIAVAGPSISRDLHFSVLDFGWVLAAFSFGYSLAQVPGGLIADRFGPRIVLVVAPILWSLFVGATGVASTLSAMIVARLLFGLCEGAANAPLLKMVGQHIPEAEHGVANGLWLTAYAFGPAVAAPIVVALELSLGWRGVFFACAVPGIAVALLLAWLLPRDLPAAPAPARMTARFADLLRWPTTWLLFFATFAMTIGYWGLLGWLPAYLSSARGLDIKAMGWAASIPYLTAAIGLVTVGVLDRRLRGSGRPVLVSCCALLAALGLLFAFTAATPVQSVAGLSFAAAFLFGQLAPFAALMIGLPPEASRGAFAGLISTGTQCAGIVAPLVIGFVVRETGSFTGGFVFMIGSLLVSAVCYAALQILGGAAPPNRAATPQLAL